MRVDYVCCELIHQGGWAEGLVFILVYVLVMKVIILMELRVQLA